MAVPGEKQELLRRNGTVEVPMLRTSATHPHHSVKNEKPGLGTFLVVLFLSHCFDEKTTEYDVCMLNGFVEAVH